MKCYKLIGLVFILLTFATFVKAQSEPCKGSQFITDAQFFRANGSAVSSDATASKKKAIGNARTNLISQISTKSNSAAKTQSKITNADMSSFLEFIQIAIRQEAMNMKVACEDSNQANGKYNTSIVVELAKEKILSAIIGQIKSEEKIKTNFEEERFKQAF